NKQRPAAPVEAEARSARSLRTIALITPFKIEGINHASQTGDDHLARESAENSLKLERRVSARAHERANEKFDGKQRKKAIEDQLRRCGPPQKQAKKSHRQEHREPCEDASDEAAGERLEPVR